MDSTSDAGITTRLKEYIENKGFSNSYFADTAGIPRPTLSQLLSGRNKSISDLLLRKIHDAFPDLNIMWLLFGLGDMQNNPNIKISEAQNGFFDTFSPAQVSDEDMPKYGRTESSSYSQNSIKEQKIEDDSSSAPKIASESQTEPVSLPFSSAASMEKNDSGERRVKSIIILYSDSSFEVFTPDS